MEQNCEKALPAEVCSTLSTTRSGSEGSHASLSTSNNVTAPQQQLKRSYPPLLLTDRDSAGAESDWWKTTVVYEVYVRSFCDSTGNGIGDLTGILSKLSYFEDLGVETLWLSPIYPSPMVDFGYDISNFVDVHPLFGTLADFKILISSMKAKSLKLVMDLVPNHTSDQHPWFLKSVRRESFYSDYYVWKKAEKGLDEHGKPIPPNNWVSVFGGSAWEWNETRQEFYLHQFAKEQPDLNYNNPAVHEEMVSVIKFWLDLGVDGFRLDALPFLFEDPEFRDELPAEKTEKVKLGPEPSPTQYEYWDHTYTFDLTDTLNVLNKFRQVCDAYSKSDGHTRVLMAECYMNTKAVMKYYSNKEQKLAHFPFNFDLLALNNKSTGIDAFHLISGWMDNLPLGSSCPNWVIGNHDTSRVASRLGPELIDAMNMILLLLPGVAVSYYGEEIGMTDAEISWENTLDPCGILAGKDKYQMYSRDPERTPMQWNNTKLAGFSSGTTSWLPVNPNNVTVNVEAELDAKESHLKVYKALTALRQWEAFRGGLEMRVLNEGSVLAFTRRVTDVNTPGLLVAVNFGNETVQVDLTCFPSLPKDLSLLIQSVPVAESTKPRLYLRDTAIKASKVQMRPKEGVVLGISEEAQGCCCSAFVHV